jgi:hypothetical protein
MKRIHCKEEQNKTNTNFTTEEREKNKSNRKKNTTKQTII